MWFDTMTLMNLQHSNLYTNWMEKRQQIVREKCGYFRSNGNGTNAAEKASETTEFYRKFKFHMSRCVVLARIMSHGSGWCQEQRKYWKCRNLFRWTCAHRASSNHRATRGIWAMFPRRPLFFIFFSARSIITLLHEFVGHPRRQLSRFISHLLKAITRSFCYGKIKIQTKFAQIQFD